MTLPQQRPAWSIHKQPNRYESLWATNGTGGPSGSELFKRSKAMRCRNCGEVVDGLKRERRGCK